MSGQDNLRDRIASVVAERNAYFGGHTGRADPKAVARAIIDELGLTVEQRDTGLQSNPPGRRIYVSRVVGDWDD